jgi:transcriptional regulator with XRE-family HTH domain
MQSLLPEPDWIDAPRRHAPRAPSYAGLTQRAAFADWLKAQREKRRLSRKEIARKVWPRSAAMATTAQIKRYETVKRDERGRPIDVTLPSPGTLRKISQALGISWLEAFAFAGYFREILQALAALAELGRQWLAEDKAFGDDGAAGSFRGFGVIRLNGKIVWEALKERRYAARYTLGYWEEGPYEPRPASDYEGLDPDLVVMMKTNDERESREPQRVPCVVPKPMAVAILVAAAGFPRRGDIYKDGTNIYAANLLSAATLLVEAAEASIGKRRTLPPLLQKADDVLKDRLLPLDSKRVIAAEYVVAWADRECNRYTHIARLGAFDYFGEAGSSMKTLTAFVELPQIRRVELPDPAEFTHLEQTQAQ